MNLIEWSPKSHLSKEKLDFLLKHFLSVPYDVLDLGFVIEVGIYEGGTLLEMVRHRRTHNFIGYDTFVGLPSLTEQDRNTDEPHNLGDFSVSSDREHFMCDAMERMQLYFATQGAVSIFCREFPINVGDYPISFAHVDVDLYHSTSESLKYLARNMIKGGKVVVDDYGWQRTPGVEIAVDSVDSADFKVIDRSEWHQIVLEHR